MSISINLIGKVPPPIGGVTIHTLRLYQWLKKKDDIKIILSALNKHDIKDESIQYIGSFFPWIVKKLFFGFREDIVHYQGANFFGLLLLSLVKKIHPSFKLIWSIHSEYLVPRLLSNSIFTRAYRQVTLTIVDNINIKTQLINGGFSKENIYIISPFFMPDNYSSEKSNILDKYRSENKKILIFNAFKLVFNAEKQDVYGLDTLLKSFDLVDTNTILILLIPSMNKLEKDYYNSLLSKVDKKNRERIILINDIKTEGWKYIQSADIFIRPTITDGDALSIREALYTGVATLVSDCTVRPKGVHLFKTSDHESLAQSLNSLLVNKDLESPTIEENNIDLFVECYKKLKYREGV